MWLRVGQKDWLFAPPSVVFALLLLAHDYFFAQVPA